MRSTPELPVARSWIPKRHPAPLDFSLKSRTVKPFPMTSKTFKASLRLLCLVALTFLFTVAALQILTHL